MSRPAVRVFLFHTGSIKSRNRSARDKHINMFLFHTGSIKSGDILRRADSKELSFYSILVRLKDEFDFAKVFVGKVSIPYWFD